MAGKFEKYHTGARGLGDTRNAKKNDQILGLLSKTFCIIYKFMKIVNHKLGCGKESPYCVLLKKNKIPHLIQQWILYPFNNLFGQAKFYILQTKFNVLIVDE